MNLKPDQLSALSLGYSNMPHKSDEVTLAWESVTFCLSTEISSTPKYRKSYHHTPEEIAQQLRVDTNGTLWWIKGKQGRQNKVGCLNDKGRLVVRIDSKIYLNHVLCFCLYHSRWPNAHMDIDHINSIRTDNRKENLREVNRSENSLNSNKALGQSGYRNIVFDNYKNLWRVVQAINGKYRTKYFKTLNAAIVFRDSARNEFGIINFDLKLSGISL